MREPDFGGMAFRYALADQLTGSPHITRFLMAAKCQDDGATLFAQKDFAGALRKLEAAFQQVDGISELAVMRATIQTALVSAYATNGRFDEAVRAGRAALPLLDADPCLALCKGTCLHDLGGALVQSGDIAEGLSLMERALAIYETFPNAAEQAAMCMGNIRLVRESLAGQSNRLSRPRRGWLSRLFGRQS